MGRAAIELQRENIEDFLCDVQASVSRAFAALNADVRSSLGHRADLAALSPMFLATMGLAQIVTTGRVPSPAWFNFCWWSFRSFLTFHKDAPTDETDPAPSHVETPRPP